jgi:inward rectifier potassium channel
MAYRQIRSALTRARELLTPGFGQPRERVRSLAGRRIIAQGLEHSFWKDFYFNAMTASWPTFFGALAAGFVVLNLVFACLYSFGKDPIANAPKGDFSDLFFFSVETSSTVGYGDMHPQTFYGHAISTFEGFVAIVLIAMMTGLTFARFSRPRARLVFAQHPVIADHDGQPTLIFRLANARNAFISEATAKLWMLGAKTSQEGRRFVGFQPLRLLRNENPAFALSWTLFHPIEPDSPLYGIAMDDLVASEINFVLMISGYDDTSAQLVRTRETFSAHDLRPGHEFVDIQSLDENGVRRIDYARIHDTRPVRVAASPARQVEEALVEAGQD